MHCVRHFLSGDTEDAFDGAGVGVAVRIKVVSQHVAVLIDEQLHICGAGSSPQVTQLLDGIPALGLVHGNRLGVQFLDVVGQHRGGVGAGVVLQVGTVLADDAADWANAGLVLLDGIGWQVGDAQLAGVQHLGGDVYW